MSPIWAGRTRFRDQGLKPGEMVIFSFSEVLKAANGGCLKRKNHTDGFRSIALRKLENHEKHE